MQIWIPLIPVVLVTLTYVLVPGFLFNLACGINWRSALGLAPLSSIGFVGVSGVLAGLLDVAWGPLPMVVIVGLATIVVWGLRALLQTRVPKLFEGAGEVKPSHWGWLLAAGLTAVILLVIDSMRMLGTPTNFSQTWDNIFHLNAMQWMVQEQNGSSLAGILGGDPSFYPAAWHAFGSLTLLTMGSTDVVAATSALIIVTVAVVWPLSSFTLIARIVPMRPTVAMATGVLVASFGAFPYIFVGYGVLYPNLLGYSLLPAMVALGVSLLKLGEGSTLPLAPTLVLAAWGGVAISMAHPNATVTLISVIATVMIVFWALTPVFKGLKSTGWQRKYWWNLLALVGWLVLAMVVFYALRPIITEWQPVTSFLGASLEGVLLAPWVTKTIWILVPLTLIGMIGILWTGRHAWLLGTHAALLFLWIVAGAEQVGSLRSLAIGPWYTDPPRLAALLPLTGLPLAVIGICWLTELFQATVTRKSWRVPSWLSASTPVVVAVVLVLTTQLSSGKTYILDWVRATYEITDSDWLLSADEYAVIQRVNDFVAPDEVIAVNPLTGGSMVFALTGRRATTYSPYLNPSPEKQILIDHLNEAATNPAVCPAVRDLDVGWVLYFGDEYFINNYYYPFPGWENLSTSPGFELAYEQGDAALYRITACD